MMKHVPNILSISRIIFVILLIFFYKNGSLFIGLYTAAVVSDLLDGFIARRTNNQSRFGARLDSFADVCMYGIVIVVIFYWARDLLKPFIPWIAIIALIRVGNFLIAACKYHVFAGLHTWANKLAGVLIFLTPIVFYATRNTVFFWITCLVALLSAIEEGLIHLTSETLDENRRSLIHKDI